MKCKLLTLCLVALVLLCPAWSQSLQPHKGGDLVRYNVRRVVLDGKLIRVQGCLTRIYAFTNLGITIDKAVDDRGVDLRLRSANLHWAKDMCYELTFHCDYPDVKSVDLELVLRTSSGKAPTKGKFDVQRDVKRDYLFGD